jgi:hypothetical protein
MTDTAAPHIRVTKDLADEAVENHSFDLRDKFLKKKRRVDERKVTMDGDEVTIQVQALTQKELDDIYAANPKRRNKDTDTTLGANSETFPPALFAASILDPKLNDDEWHDIWTSPDWSPGELGHLLDIVMNTTTRGFDPPFGGRG